MSGPKLVNHLIFFKVQEESFWAEGVIMSDSVDCK